MINCTLRDFSKPVQAQAKTGTDDGSTGPREGQDHLAIHLAKTGRLGETPLDDPGQQSLTPNASEQREDVQNRDSRSENANGRSRTITIHVPGSKSRVK